MVGSNDNDIDQAILEMSDTELDRFVDDLLSSPSDVELAGHIAFHALVSFIEEKGLTEEFMECCPPNKGVAIIVTSEHIESKKKAES